MIDEVSQPDGVSRGEFEGFRRWQLRVQRLGRTGMALVVLLALLGVFGLGGISHVHSRSAGSEIHFERFLRREMPTYLTIILPASEADAALSRVMLEHEWDAMHVDSVAPLPVEVATNGDKHIYAFSTGRAGSVVRFCILPRKAGWLLVRLSIDGGPEFKMRPFVWP